MYKIVLLIKLYRRSSLGRFDNKRIRADILKNHFSRKEYLTLIKDIVSIRSEFGGSSKRVKDIIEKL